MPTQRMPNPSAVPLVYPPGDQRAGKLTEPWIRWFQDITGEITAANVPATPAPPAPAPAPTPDPAPATADLISALDARIEGVEQEPVGSQDARIAALERAVHDLQQGSEP